MPRLPVIETDQATGKTKELYDALEKKAGKVLNIWKGMGNSPAALNAYVALSGAVSEGEISAPEREVIALALAQANDCHYCQAAHTAIAKGAGIAEEETVAIRKGASTNPKYQALAEFVLAVQDTKGFVSDEQIAAVKAAGYSDGAIAEIPAVMALNLYTNWFNHINDTEIDFPEPPAV